MSPDSWITNTWLFELFYNVLIGLTNLFPGASIAIGVILLTLIVKTILIPLTYRSIRHQIRQKELQPLLDEIREQYKDDKETQSRKIMELYQQKKMNPFSGCFLIIIQIIVIIPLYYTFLNFQIMPDKLYGFVSVPESLNTMFLGIDLAGRSIILAVLTGASQFFQLYFSPAMRDTGKLTVNTSSQAAMMQSMQRSMKYTMPILIGFFAYAVPAAVAVYWIVSNIFTIAQEIVIRKKLEREAKAPVAEVIS